MVQGDICCVGNFCSVPHLLEVNLIHCCDHGVFADDFDHFVFLVFDHLVCDIGFLSFPYGYQIEFGSDDPRGILGQFG